MLRSTRKVVSNVGCSATDPSLTLAGEKASKKMMQAQDEKFGFPISVSVGRGGERVQPWMLAVHRAVDRMGRRQRLAVTPCDPMQTGVERKLVLRGASPCQSRRLG